MNKFNRLKEKFASREQIIKAGLRSIPAPMAQEP